MFLLMQMDNGRGNFVWAVVKESYTDQFINRKYIKKKKRKIKTQKSL